LFVHLYPQYSFFVQQDANLPLLQLDKRVGKAKTFPRPKYG